jgi:O-antigen ligase
MPRAHRSHNFSENEPLSKFAVADEPMAHRLHPLEAVLLAVIATHLTFLPWALGTMHVWSQSISFGLSAMSIGLALWPRNYPGLGDSGLPFRVRMLPTLLRFPVFWFGGLFLLFTVVQALNPAWELVRTGQGPWLQGVSHLTWLPSGLRTPFAQSSPWRALLIYGAAWMSTCAIWTGFTRRKALRILLVLLAVNAFLLALFGLLQRALHADKIFWSWKPPASYFVSSFIYRNHAGAYFDLTLAICCALGPWYYRRQVRRKEPSSPAVLFGFFAAIIATVVLYSYSRGATLLMIGSLAVATALVARGSAASREAGRSPFTVMFVGVVFVAVIGLSLYSLKTDRMAERLRGLRQEAMAGSENGRLIVYRATWEMIQDQPWLGWGAGSWQFCFPGYQVRHPEICIARDSGKRMFYEHAHNDYLELLTEYGVVGCSFVLAGLCFYLSRLIRLKVWQNAPAAILLLGCLVTMGHAAFDFPFFNPAVLITWCCLWPVILRWLEIESLHAPVEEGR